MNPMELVYFTEEGRLELDHECEMCENYPLENIDEPCLACGYTQIDLLAVMNHIAKANKAIDFYNSSQHNGKDDDKPVVVQGTLTLSHVSLGGNDCNKIVLSDYSDSPQLVQLFAPFIHHECDVVIYPKSVSEEILDWWV